MRSLIAWFLTISLTSVICAAAPENKPPRRLVFPSKAGDVVFDHRAHVKREKKACPECHDILWPQSAKVPVTSSSGCGTCHHADGKSFEMKGNCMRCHATKSTTDRPRS
jgi:c(7)-type cytochrome triheme protein